MDWYNKWPREALVAVSRHFISKVPVVSTEKVKNALIDAMGVFHDQVATTCGQYFERLGFIINTNLFNLELSNTTFYFQVNLNKN